MVFKSCTHQHYTVGYTSYISMFTNLYLEHSIPIKLSYERVRFSVIGAGSSAVLSAHLTKMYSRRSTEALWLGSFSHWAPTAPLCRGKTNTEPFTPRQAVTWQDRQTTISLSEIHFERYSTAYSDCENNALFQMERCRTGNNRPENMFE